MNPPGGGGLVTAPSGRIYEVVVPATADYGQGAANVVKVPWSENHPWMPRLGLWW